MIYSLIAIIYNPNSTGPSESLARELKNKLREKLPKQEIELLATKHAGHAEELAYSIAHASKNPLIISSSGDGGYHEVINGALKAQAESARPTTGLLPAGNANDHHRNLHDEDIADQIIQGKTKRIDALKLTAQSKGKRIERYAHSYIGIGLTPIVAAELNKKKLNLFTEAWTVFSSLVKRKSVRLKIDGTTKRYESIIFSNIATMSKYLKVSKVSDVADGKFEVTITKRTGWWQFILTLLKATSGTMSEDMQTTNFSLTTVRRTALQADGEIMYIDANTSVDISIERQALRSIV